MTADEPTREITGDSPEGAQVARLVEMWRTTLSMANGGSIAPDELSRAVTAAAVLAGALFGHTIAAGMATDRDKRRAGDVMLRNFRSGIDIGKRAGERAIAAMPVGRHA